VKKKYAHNKNLSVVRLALLFSFSSLALPLSPAIPEEREAFKKDISYDLELAKSYMRQGLAGGGDPVYYDKAIALYNKILKEDPKNKEAMAGLADMQTLISKPAAGLPAREQYKRGVEDSLDLATSFMRQGLAGSDQGFYFNKAYAQYEDALKAAPGNREALAGLAEISVRTGDTAKADDFYKKLAAVDPAYAAAHKSRILKNITEQAPKAMVSPAAAVAAAAPAAAKDKDYKLDLAKSYMQQGLANSSDPVYLDIAMRHYEDILKTSPGEKVALQGLAAIYAQKGNVRKAEKLIKKLIESEPDNLQHQVNMAFFYYSSGMKDKALEEIDRVISKDPRIGRARILRAVIYEERADLPAAIAEYENTARLAIETKNAVILSQALIGLSRLYDKAQLYFDAMFQLERLVSFIPDFPDASLELARLSFRIGLTDKAISTLRSLIKIKPNVPQAYALLGLAYYKKNDFDTSLDYLKKAKLAGIAITDEMLATVEQKAKEFWDKGKSR
jgi:tetratricopeptide (TPR) repeat protein